MVCFNILAICDLQSTIDANQIKSNRINNNEKLLLNPNPMIGDFSFFFFLTHTYYKYEQFVPIFAASKNIIYFFSLFLQLNK